MKRRYKIGLGMCVGIALGVFIGFLFHGLNFQVLDPQGVIGREQRGLLIFATSLSLVVVVPVFTLLGVIAWRYREGNKKADARHRPNQKDNTFAEIVWWVIPCILIGIIGVVIWQSSHALDPYKPLDSKVKPINVQVVALQWRWLFIYPDEKVASINYMSAPVDTPINFTITADAPMNSFWIPRLGGQVYAMNGMSTKLHLMADTPGDYPGSSVNISGKGFAKMRFTAHVTTDSEYRQWLKETATKTSLDWERYQALARPTDDTSSHFYALKDANLYSKVIEKYMPTGTHDVQKGDHSKNNESHSMDGMSMDDMQMMDHSQMKGHGE